VAIVPDDKDWTWVLERTCPECGFDVRTFERTRVAELIRANAEQWQVVLSSPSVRRRPAADRWSPLEYACHVRDVFRLYDYRLGLMLDTDDPLFPNWDQDVTAEQERYGEREPVAVAHELADAAEELAEHFDGVHGEQWARTGRRSDGANFTVESFARYLIHDPVHHLHDVGVRME
jgi:hypothetical protein